MNNRTPLSSQQIVSPPDKLIATTIVYWTLVIITFAFPLEVCTTTCFTFPVGLGLILIFGSFTTLLNINNLGGSNSSNYFSALILALFLAIIPVTLTVLSVKRNRQYKRQQQAIASYYATQNQSSEQQGTTSLPFADS